MPRFRTLFSLFLLAGFAATLSAQSSDRLYGKIITSDGETLQGFIRWGGTEVSWFDLLNGNKTIPDEYLDELKAKDPRYTEDPDGGFTFLGVRFGWDDVPHLSKQVSSSLRFGYIRRMETDRRNGLIITLKNGRVLEYAGGSNDLGSGLGTTSIEDEKKGPVKLKWRDVDIVEFSSAPKKESKDGQRLFGTLTTRQGVRFTGIVTWDVDEVFTREILDGDEKGRDRKYPFADIVAIQRDGWSGSTVRLKSGEEVRLTDSNDVDEDNRGIFISDPALGQVTVGWDDFEKIEFSQAPDSLNYDSFAPIRRLHGTVLAENGKSYTGEIRWDNDEEYSWESLDGQDRDVTFAIEFSFIRSVEKMSRRASRVTLKDGRSFELDGSNDVNEDNKGIFIRLSSGESVLVPWSEVRKVDFSS